MKRRLKSFTYAFAGLRILIKEEPNAMLHLAAAIFVITLGFVMELSRLEWVSIIFSIGLVITLEIINTAIENIADFISPEKHASIKKIKDLGAAAVLLGAIVAMGIGLLVFLPKII